MKLLSLPFVLCPTLLMAETPSVVTDIAPIHSLTAMVMDGVGAPHQLLPQGADPHDFALRPSDAKALGDANLVIWVGASLTPWMADPLETLAGDAVHLTLLETEGWTKLDFPEGGHDHGHGDEDHEDDHDDDHEGEHDEEHHDDHEDEHAGDVDPHAWLSPVAASAWLSHISEELSAIDPDNAATYAANAAAAAQDLAALSSEISGQLNAAQIGPYVLPHAALQYFEVQFGVPSAGTVGAYDNATPGPAHIAELKAEMEDVVCVLHEPTNDKWAKLLTEGTDAKIAPLDLTGAMQTSGADLYPAMMRDIAANLIDCAS